MLEVRLPSYIPGAWRDRILVVYDARGVHYIWTGWHNGQGHGKVSVAGKVKYTHRIIFENVSGIKLKRFDYVDHLCKHKGCLNFDCLEAVTPKENTARSRRALSI